jgi:Tol biopolymer transport system component
MAFGPWSEPVHLGPIVNAIQHQDAGPEISSDGLALYFHTGRVSGVDSDIFVTRRKAIDLPWEAPFPPGPHVNSASHEAGPILSKNGLNLFFGSQRSGNWEIYLARRRNAHDDSAWDTPVALPAPINGPSFDVPGDYFEPDHGRPALYFQSDRANGGGAAGLDIYVTELRGKSWSAPEAVHELNSAAQDARPTVRSDGLEVIFASNRDGSLDLYVARRDHVWEPWSTPESLGPSINTAAVENQPSLSQDGRTLYFFSNRANGDLDLYVSTRSPLRSRGWK